MLIIGTGSIAMRHVANLMRRRNVCVTLLSRSRDRIEPMPDCCELIYDPYAQEDLSAFTHAIIASQTSSHLRDLNQCLGSIYSVYLEKPAYLSSELIDPVIDEFIQSGGFLYHGFMMRHHPIIKYASSWILGHSARIMSAHFSIGQKLSDWRPMLESDEYVSYSYDSARGGTVFLDLIHEVDLLLKFFGPVASAVGFSRDFEEKGVVRVASGDGICLHENSVISMIHLDSVDPVGHRTIKFFGDQLYFEANLLSGEIKHHLDGELKTLVLESDRNEMFLESLEEFIVMSELEKEARRKMALINRDIALTSLRLAESLSDRGVARLLGNNL